MDGRMRREENRRTETRDKRNSGRGIGEAKMSSLATCLEEPRGLEELGNLLRGGMRGQTLWAPVNHACPSKPVLNNRRRECEKGDVTRKSD